MDLRAEGAGRVGDDSLCRYGERNAACFRRGRALPGSKSALPTSPRLRSMPSSMRQTVRCSAAAASTARSIAPRDRNCSPNAGRSAAAKPAAQRSRAAIGCAAKHVIHAVGPVWSGGGKGEEELLASCYRVALDLASTHRLASIAFPAISTGIYRFPPDRAARIAVGIVTSEVASSPRGIGRVVFCCFAQDIADHHVAAFADLGLATDAG